jgi:hypothetical protein
MSDNMDWNQSVQSVQAKKWYKCKKIIVPTVGFLIIFLAVSVYLSNTNTKPMKEAVKVDSRDLNWVTYTNDEFNFSIDFPVEWGMGVDKITESVSGDRSGNLNLIFCPPENKVLEDYSDAFGACRIEYTEEVDGGNGLSYQGPLIYLSVWPNDNPEIAKKYEDFLEMKKRNPDKEYYEDYLLTQKLSPDKKYFYNLSLRYGGNSDTYYGLAGLRYDGDNRYYSDVYSVIASSLKFTDGKSADEIVWLEPQKLDDLKIFAPYTPDHINNYYIKLGGRQFEPIYHLVGRINSGKYAGSDIISAIFGVDGKSYTLLKTNGSYRILSKYNDDFNDYDPNNFATKLNIDPVYDIPGLDCPDEISLTFSAHIFQKTDEPENIFDPNSPETKESLSSKKIDKGLDGRDIYNLSDGEEIKEIGILLPNGTLVIYSL